MLSVVSPRNLESLQRVFNAVRTYLSMKPIFQAKPDIEVPVTTKLSPGLQLCRGISPATGSICELFKF